LLFTLKERYSFEYFCVTAFSLISISAGIIHVLATRYAPSIFPLAAYRVTVLFETSHFFAISFADKNGQKKEKELDAGAIKKAVEDLNRKMQNTEAQYSVHEGTNRIMIKILDKDSQKVIKEITPEKMLDAIQNIWETGLTNLYNRRAYENDISELSKATPASDLVYISMDVNGLKVINDTIGHVAGDELILGSSECMRNVLKPYGKVYRIGGDEFVAILNVSSELINEVLSEFDNAINAWSGELVDNLSISYGIASSIEFPEESIRVLSSIAEKRMYETKSEHYRKQGVDRRGQQDAHKALCDLYTKVLRINLTEDSYQIVNMDASEQTKEKGFSDKISDWFTAFAKSGQVHPDDVEEYLTMTNFRYLKDYFKSHNTSLQIFYRRKYEDGFKKVMMEIIPANDYSDDNQSLFLYVKNIEI